LIFQLLLDIPPPIEYTASTVGIGLAAVFFLIFCGIAVFAYKMLKRTMKMAFRMMIVALILIIAVVGSVAFYFGVQTPKKQDTRTTPRNRNAR
jgi:membrane protein implicated in regulation of membrane protease activity